MEEKTELQSHPLIDKEWEEVVESIPVDLEKSARESKALIRRREIKSASDLLRLVLAYSLCDWSLRLVGAWAVVIGLGKLSDVAVMKRLKKAVPWLRVLISALLEARQIKLKAAHPVRVRIVDGSVITELGSKGTDWRLHATFDLGSQQIDGVEITDAKGGETLLRHEAQPGEIWIADRGYAHRSGVGAILEKGVHIVLRLAWATFPLEEDKTPFDLFGWLRKLPKREPGEREVWVTTPMGRFKLRLIAQRLPKDAVKKARKRLCKKAKKRGKTPDRRALRAAGFMMLVTSLPAAQWTAASVLALYRFRWQIELVFKRLKSILDLDQLRAKDPELAQAYLLGKLLAALLLDMGTDMAVQQYPELFEAEESSLSLWRWMMIGRDILYNIVRGYISLARFLEKLPSLMKRYLSVGSRHKRRHQAAEAKGLLSRVLGEQATKLPALS